MSDETYIDTAPSAAAMRDATRNWNIPVEVSDLIASVGYDPNHYYLCAGALIESVKGGDIVRWDDTYHFVSGAIVVTPMEPDDNTVRALPDLVIVQTPTSNVGTSIMVGSRVILYVNLNQAGL